MTKKDYARLARVVDYCTSEVLESNGVKLVFKPSLVDELVDWLGDDNSRFDEAKFRKACGPLS